MRLLCLANFAAAVCLVFGTLAYAAGPAHTAITSLIAEAESGEITTPQLVDSLVSIAERYSTTLAESLKGLSVNKPDFEQLLGEALVARAEVLLSKGPAPEAMQGIDALAAQFLGPENAHFKKLASLRRLSERVSTLSKRSPLNDFLVLDRMVDSPEAMSIVGRRLGPDFLYHVKNLAQTRTGFLALPKIAALRRIYPGREIDAVAVEVLANLAETLRRGGNPKGNWSLDDKVTQDYVEELMGRGDREANAVFTINSWKAIQSISEGKSEEASKFYDWILRRRPDPSKANDALRLAMVQSAAGAEAKTFAQERFDELGERGKVPGSKKIGLFLRGFYGRAPLIAFFVVIVGFFVAVILFALRAQPSVAKLGAIFSSTLGDKIKLGKKKGNYTQVTVSDDEYTTLLSKLGLDEKASESQIKKAFRKMVKEQHPDTSNADDGNDGFQDLRKTYDRIMEIRGSWFGR